MKKNYTLICFLMFTSVVNAQYFEKCYGGSNDEYAGGSVGTADKGFIVVGSSKSNDGDVTGHHGSLLKEDAWVIKLNATGTIVWQKSIGGDNDDAFSSIIRTLDGKFICFGNTTSNNGDVMGNNGSRDAWIVKIDRNGNIIWSKCFGTAQDESVGRGIQLSDSSIIFIQNSPTTNSVVKINSDGNFIWEKAFSGNCLDLYTNPQNSNSFFILRSTSFSNTIDEQFDANTGLVISSRTISYLPYPNNSVCRYNDTDFVYTRGGSYIVGGLGTQCAGATWNFVDVKNKKGYNTFNGNLICLTNPGFMPYPVNTAHSVERVNDSTIVAMAYEVDESEWTNYFNNYTTYGIFKIRQGGYTPIEGFMSNIPFGSPGSSDNSGSTYLTAASVSPFTKEIMLSGRTNVPYGNHGNIISGSGGGSLSSTTDFAVVKTNPYFRNTIFGNVFKDDNLNGIKDIGEKNVAVVVSSSKSSYNASSTSDNGRFTNEVDSGKYTTKINFNKLYYTTLPTSKQSVFSGDGGRDSVNFALQAAPNKTDLQLNLYTTSNARAGFNIDYVLNYQNIGTDTTDGIIKLLKDSRLTFVSATPNYDAINGDTLIWNVSNLYPEISGNISIIYNIPSFVSITDSLKTFAQIVPTKTDETPYDNIQYNWKIITGSYDPNDKNEIHNGKYTLTDLGNKEALLYTIRFQNTGNDTAFTVQVKDSLDNKLDINSFEMVSASHNYKLSIVDNKYCTWTFNDILLVDSNHNEAASHGYITYRIVPKSTVVHNDVINNSASIYFDFNLPVQTNVHKTTIINTALPVRLQSFTGKQNNKTVLLNWLSANEINMDKYIVEKSVDGIKYNVLGTIQATNKDNSVYQFTDEQPSKAVNYYRLKMVETNGRYSYSEVIQIRFNKLANQLVNVYPNPTKDNLTIECKGIKQIKVVNILGQTIQQLNNLTTQQTPNTKQTITINTKQWNKGIYIVSFDNGEKVKVVKE